MLKIICEAGLAWESFDEAVLYAEKAKEIGADIIKYQWIEDDSLPGNECHLNKGEWKALKRYCDMIDIEFMCTPSSVEILTNLFLNGVNIIKIGSDRIKQNDLYKYHAEYNELNGSVYTNSIFCKYLISDGYDSNGYENMYCVSLYPCDKKFIDFNRMAYDKYIGFSDHTLEYNKEWCDKIKTCKNIQYVEKHFKLRDDCIDSNVSLNVEQMREFINNLKEA